MSVNHGLARMLDNYLINCWASGSYSRRLVRTSNVFTGNHYSSFFQKSFRAVWCKQPNRSYGDKDLIIALFPNGTILYNSHTLQGSLSSRAYSIFYRWVANNTIDLERTYRLDGVEFEVRRISVPVFNIATNGHGRYSGDNAFASHLSENLTTSEE